MSTYYLSDNAYEYRLLIKLFTKMLDRKVYEYYKFSTYLFLKVYTASLPSICIAKIYTVHIMKEFQMSANVVNVGEWPYFCDVFLNE